MQFPALRHCQHFPADLELGHVLLFPINDKQSRPDGEDQVSHGDKRERKFVYAQGPWRWSEPVSSAGSDRGAGERPSQQPLRDPPERSGPRPEEDLPGSQKKKRWVQRRKDLPL